MSTTRPGRMFVLLSVIFLFLGGAVVVSTARPPVRPHARAVKRWRAGRHKAVIKHRGKRRVLGKRRVRRVPAKSKPVTIAAPAAPVVNPPVAPVAVKPSAVGPPASKSKSKPIAAVAKPVHISRSELVARHIDAAVGHDHEIVKMLKTGTERGGVYLAYVPAKGARPTPSKLICEIDLSNKDVIDEYYYSAGHLIFVRETVRNYPLDGRTKALDFEHPTYKEPVAIPFVRGHIAGSAKLRKRERSLLFDSKFLLTLVHAKGSPVDVERWVKSPQI